MMNRLTMMLLSILVLSTLVSAQEVPSPQAPAAAQQSPAQRATAAQLANIRIELTIVDQRDNAASPPKTVTLLVEDRQNGRIRAARGNANLNVDARPEILREGRIRVMMSLEYAPQDSPDRAAPTPIQESMTALLEDGKPLVVSQSADPSSDRKVRLEVKATIVK